MRQGNMQERAKARTELKEGLILAAMMAVAMGIKTWLGTMWEGWFSTMSTLGGATMLIFGLWVALRAWRNLKE